MAGKSRSIFEDVASADKARGAPVAKGAIDAKSRGARGAIRYWLMLLFALVVVMIAVGGLTRLTDSGLSITEWKPLSGMIPPLSGPEWLAEFDAYKQTAEYQQQNAGMTLDAFKTIFWWEWGHRQLGRVIGLVWAIGFFGFLVARKIPVGWTGRLLFVGALGGLQGAVGWWMVTSGLQPGQLDVESYRLATHLGLAFVIFGFLAWYMFLLGRREGDLMQARRNGDPRLVSWSTGLLCFAFVQILLGALVAGIDAGRAFPTWPPMGDGFLPPDPLMLTPLWRNFFEDAGLVQFIHRMGAYVLFILGVVVWWKGRKSANGTTRFAFHALLTMLLVQMIVGIVTVLYSAPLQIAIVHQFGAVVLWVLILRARYLARYPLPQSIRGKTA